MSIVRMEYLLFGSFIRNRKDSTMFENPYNAPERHGLEILCTIEDFSARNDYGFRLFVLWRHTTTGTLYRATDAGCSCPSPFEEYYGLTDLHELNSGNRNEFTAAALEFANGGYWTSESLTYKVTEMLSKISGYLIR